MLLPPAPGALGVQPVHVQSTGEEEPRDLSCLDRISKVPNLYGLELPFAYDMFPPQTKPAAWELQSGERSAAIECTLQFVEIHHHCLRVQFRHEPHRFVPSAEATYSERTGQVQQQYSCQRQAPQPPRKAQAVAAKKRPASSGIDLVRPRAPAKVKRVRRITSVYSITTIRGVGGGAGGPSDAHRERAPPPLLLYYLQHMHTSPRTPVPAPAPAPKKDRSPDCQREPPPLLLLHMHTRPRTPAQSPSPTKAPKPRLPARASPKTLASVHKCADSRWSRRHVEIEKRPPEKHSSRARNSSIIARNSSMTQLLTDLLTALRVSVVIGPANSESNSCEKCRRHFTLVYRRHHCRGCGKVVCDKCSEHRVVLPENYNYGPNKQRVCDTCYVTLVAIEYQVGLEQGKVVPPDYAAIRAELLERVKTYLSLSESGWGSEGDANGVKVWLLIKAPIKKVMEVYSNMEVWKNWNPYVSSRTIEQIDPTSKVMSAVYEFPVIDKRGSCFYTSIMESSTFESLKDAKGLTVAGYLELAGDSVPPTGKESCPKLKYVVDTYL
ncbi:hypothetical protein AXG93_4225s1140 [Marchantia polymorpha subsp. ruderalis]|uniref:FYVE-type domain-containing protein n=1 Tax=Marchantia polymorpha subsp. ruderalis TaxID=1480154 RepID=A0A176WT87_MARPO|nr:hypothetical protein AXG93_4225s1140 [Marchantia polymorpha subsp. ruderalis]